MKKLLLIITTIVLILIVSFVYFNIPDEYPPIENNLFLNDASALNRTKVNKIFKINSTNDIQKALHYADSSGLEISIAGKRHSMGGHSLYPDAVILDMTGYNKILGLDPQSKTIIVQSGATWNDIQGYLNPYNYAVIAMQGPNIFTIGGSLSVNAHGWDTKTEQVSETVEWLRVMLADGTIVKCNREENTELFHLILGGYGLFGIILDAGIKITNNALLKPENTVLSYETYNDYFDNQVVADTTVKLTYADYSISPSSFLQEMLVTNFRQIQYNPDSPISLNKESNILRDKFFINLSRKYEWGKA